jgi:hypothetical protein
MCTQQPHESPLQAHPVDSGDWEIASKGDEESAQATNRNSNEPNIPLQRKADKNIELPSTNTNVSTLHHKASCTKRDRLKEERRKGKKKKTTSNKQYATTTTTTTWYFDTTQTFQI